MYDTTEELVLLNGRVFGAERSATAVLTRGGRIAMVGADAQVRAAAKPGAQFIDLAGMSLLPGFTESHTHFHRTAVLQSHFLDFSQPGVDSIAAVIGLVAERAARLAAGAWVEGDNLIGGKLAEHRLPTRYELDSVSPANPVLLRGMGKHVVVANSVALARAGIDASTPDPHGGRIERDNDGEPTGVLHERGKLTLDTTRADTVVPPLSDQQRVEALEIGIGNLHRCGVTSLHEIVRTPEEFADYSRLREAGRLGVRVLGYLRVVEARATLDGVLAAGLRTGFGDEWIRLGGVKVSIDGACTFRNAAVYEPYLGEPENLGILRIEADELREVVRRADQGGLQVAVHAIGPRAVDMALDAFAAVAPGNGSNPLRHRIEHGYVAPVHDRLGRMARLGLLLSTQPAFIHTVGDTWFDIFPPELVQAMMPLRAALDAGLTVLANSDCPSAPPSPLLGIQAAVGRRTESGRVIGADEAVTVEEAIAMYTTAAAYAAGEEHTRGSIAMGRLADLVVLGDDPRELDVTEIAAVPVLATMVGGQVRYRHESL